MSFIKNFIPLSSTTKAFLVVSTGIILMLVGLYLL